MYGKKRSNATLALLAFVVVFLAIITGFISVEGVLANPLGLLNTVEDSLIHPIISYISYAYGLPGLALFVALIGSIIAYRRGQHR